MKDANLKERFISICQSEIKREGIDSLLQWLENSDFYTAPASTRFHGNYECGLLEHSLNVYDALKELANIHSEYQISAESLAIAALFHDLCKVNYYTVSSRNVKDEKTGQWQTHCSSGSDRFVRTAAV